MRLFAAYFPFMFRVKLFFWLFAQLLFISQIPKLCLNCFFLFVCLLTLGENSCCFPPRHLMWLLETLISNNLTEDWKKKLFIWRIHTNHVQTRVIFSRRRRKRWELHRAAADHGRSDWLGYWVEFVQKAHFKKLACLCVVKQNDLTYLGWVCTPCLSVSSGIYGAAFLNLFWLQVPVVHKFSKLLSVPVKKIF